MSATVLNNITQLVFTYSKLTMETPEYGVRLNRSSVIRDYEKDLNFHDWQKQSPVFCKKGVLRNFVKFTGKHLSQSLFFNKVAAATLLKKRLWLRCFPPNFYEISKNTFFIQHLWCLLRDWIIFYHDPFHDKVKKLKENTIRFISSKLQSCEMYPSWIC